MIARLIGTVLEVSAETCLLDVNGVGYEVHCSTTTLTDLIPHQETILWTYHHVREDAQVLYGFLDLKEKNFYLSLLKVNGIGPKMAINILSGAEHRRILLMIEAGDVKGLSSLPKVGKKTAEQIILTLKGKLVLHETDVKNAVSLSPEKSKIISALVNLGFRAADVEKVVSQISPDLKFEEGLRQSLQALSGAGKVHSEGPGL